MVKQAINSGNKRIPEKEMHKGFKDYLSDAYPEYKYTIKLAVDKVTDEMLDCIESCMSKYDLKTASKFRETPVQENPLDFPNIKNSPVFIADISLKYPASRDYLETKLSNILGLSEQNIVVYSETDPRHAETDLYMDRMVNHVNKGEHKLGKDDYKGEEAENPQGTEDQRLSILKDLEQERTERRKAGHEEYSEQDDVLPSDYDTFDKTKEDNSPGLFGRMTKH